ncbi:MAG: outer membrane beta-barrel protein [Candidatus Accumulibacter sp. UW27]
MEPYIFWRKAMMKVGTLTVALLTAALSAGTNCAWAQDALQGWHMVGSVGQSRVDLDSFDLASIGATGSESKDEKDTAWSLGIGYQFNPYIALEGGYIDFGKFKQSATIVTPLTGSLSGDVKADGWFINAIASYPVGAGFSLFGRVGTVRTTTKSSLSATGAFAGALAAAGADLSDSESEWNWRYGLGVQYDFTPRVGMRLGYDRTADVGKENTTGESNIDTWLLSVLFRF